jgi:Hint domain
MATITWKSTVASGNWSATGSWTGGALPGASDTASFASGTNNIVATLDATQSIGGLTLGSPSGTYTDELVVGSNTLNIANNATISISNAAGNDYLTLAGGQFVVSGSISVGTASSAKGTMRGYGTISAVGQIAGLGTIYANSSGHLLDVTAGTWKGSGSASVLQIGNGATLELHGAVPAAESVTFDGTSGGVLAIASTTFAGVIASTNGGLGVTTGGSAPSTNYIDLVNVGAISSVSITTLSSLSTLVVTGAGGTYNIATNQNFSSDYVNYKADAAGGNAMDIWVDTAVCYAAGTRLRTPAGEIPVEALAEGDLVVTLQGDEPVAMPVVWVGHMVVDLENHPRPETAAPIVFCPHALGSGIPARELVVSPDHAMFLDGKLIPAKLLVNGATIYQDFAARSVTYYHIETPRHSILVAEGAPAESYLDTGNRAWFNNAGVALMQHPEFEVNAYLRCWEADACAPLAVSAEAVGPVWRRLADRAVALGRVMAPVPQTSDAEVHLIADGVTVQPISTQDGRHIFIVPSGASDIRLDSRANQPSDIMPFNGDGRRLGVAVSRIVVRSGEDWRDVPLDHPALRDGWHKVERDQDRKWRWTNGSAAMPISGANDTVTLEVHLQKMAAYRISSESDRIAA